MEDPDVRNLRSRAVPLVPRPEDGEAQQRSRPASIVSSQRGTRSMATAGEDHEPSDHGNGAARSHRSGRSSTSSQRVALQLQLEEAEAEARFRAQERELQQRQAELRRRREEEEAELQRRAEELEEQRRLDQLRRAVERASLAGSTDGGSQVSRASSISSVHSEPAGARGVLEWLRNQQLGSDVRSLGHESQQGFSDYHSEPSQALPPFAAVVPPPAAVVPPPAAVVPPPAAVVPPPAAVVPPPADVIPPHTCAGNSAIEKYLTRKCIGKTLPTFSGDPSEWLQFITSFRNSTAIGNFSEAENVQRLSNALTGKAKDSVRSLLCVPNSTSRIIQILELQYGRPIVIINSLIDQVKKFPKLSEDNLSCIVDLATKVFNLTVAIEALGEHQYFTNPQLVDDVANKLNAHLKLSWGETVVRLGKVADLRDLNDFLYNKAVAATHASSELPVKSNPRQVHVLTKGSEVNNGNDKRGNGCAYCGGDHKITICETFISLGIEDRRKWVSDKKLCYLCMGRRHLASKCRINKRCDCKGLHHQLLHLERNSQEAKEVPAASIIPQAQRASHCSEPSSSVLLKILPVRIRGPSGSTVVTALLDEGADCSLIDSALAKSLGLKGKRSPLCIQWVQGEKRTEDDSEEVRLSISGINKNSRYYNLTRLRTVTGLSIPRQRVDARQLSLIWPQISKIPLNLSDQPPLLLLGQDNWTIIETCRSLRRSWNGLGLSKTRIGWVLHGRIGSGASEMCRPFHVCQVQKSDDLLHQLISESFGIDKLEDSFDPSFSNKSLSTDDQKAVAILNDTAKFVDHRWEVGLLWKFDHEPAIDSRGSALRRLFCVENKMSKDRKFAEQYRSKILDYISKGYARKLSQDEIDHPCGRTWYLPHLAVFNPNKPGKIRVVFDASSKTEGVSLNDQLLRGPDLYNSIPGILLRFRKGRIAFGGDIREMFLRIKIRDEDQGAQRFLWRDDPRQQPDEYVMQVMLFGAICSPFQAQFVRNHNASRFAETYPRAVQAIHQSHYMDDYLDSVDSVEDAVKLIEEVLYVHSSGGFEMVSWFSNSSQVLESVKGLVKSPEDVHLDPNSTEKVLGLRYLPESDSFIFRFNRNKIPTDVVSKSRRITKREFLSILMSIFDPLGFLNWWTIKGKLILQDMWRSKIGWDDEIDEGLQAKWEDWFHGLIMVESLEISRCYSSLLLNSTERELHTFCDASDRATAAVCYIKIIQGTTSCVRFMASKSRVAPLKQLSVPRLELQAAVLGARLAQMLVKDSGINFDNHYYWSDSRTVIHWIRNPDSRYQMYVAHRISEIVRLTRPEQWRWVPGHINPADDATKGKAQISDRWWSGPDFLTGGEDSWPGLAEGDVDTGELGPLERLNFVSTSQAPGVSLPDIHRFSNVSRLIRATAWSLRFIGKAKKLLERFEDLDVPASPYLQVDEERAAEVLWWRHLQDLAYSQEIADLKAGRAVQNSSQLRRLSPFLDEQGILRIRGRIDNAAVSQETKHPVILDSKSRFVELLIDHFHRKANHQGQEYVMNELRQRYWIIGLRRAVRRSWHRCVLCARERAKPFEQPMGPLPVERLQHGTRPFTCVGLDYFGPLMVTVKRTKEKRYGAIFCCLTTRAIHLELIHDLTTEGTLLAIRRMAARRGYPKTIWSDNGTNFRGAQRIIKERLEKIDQAVMNAELIKHQVTWNFLPPAAPHMGGSWERLIRSIKKALCHTMKSQAPREDVLCTLLVEAENLINSRPITTVSEDPNDPEALTPNHFLLGSSNGLPAWTHPEDRLDLRKRWQLAQHLADNFWRRWLKEYLPSLVKSTRWFGKGEDIRVDQLVYLADHKERRGCWKPGRVVALHPGADGRTRVVDVKTNEGIIRRPVVKLLPLLPTGS